MVALWLGFLLASTVCTLSLFFVAVGVMVSNVGVVLTAAVPLLLSGFAGVRIRRHLRGLGIRPWMFWLASTAAGIVCLMIGPRLLTTLAWH